MSDPPAAFYCVADSRYFLGAVAMINSLRLHGHSEPVYLLDAGLEAEQRRVLEPHASVIRVADAGPPWLLKIAGPLARPAEAMVLIDADMIVTRSLGELIARARAGELVAFGAGYERFVPEWGELLGLGDLERRPYVSSALLALGRKRLALLRRMDELRGRVQALVEADAVAAEPTYAFFALDQDLLNAVLGAAGTSAPLAVLDSRLAPVHPFAGLRLSGDGGSCVYADGAVPYAVHHLVLTPVPTLRSRGTKPWIEPHPTTVYTQLLSRYLLGPGLAIRVPADAVPVWLHDDLRGRVARLPANVRERLGWLARRRLPARVVEGLDARRRGSHASP